jgi:hypothetical protein
VCATSAGRIAAAVLACSLLAPGLAPAADGVTTSMYVDLRFMVTRPDGPKFDPKHELSR